MKILILGGYGVFGGRLATLLSDCEPLELQIAGRSLARARAFCDRFEGAATAVPVALDRADIAKRLRDDRPDLVVDASGPFQTYGPDGYAVIEACIAARVDYMDFADGADFVFGVGVFDARATAAGIFVLSGVSSFPVLTAAVVQDMTRRMDVVSLTGGIAPSPHAGIGLNVMRAVLGYAGAPVKLMRGGQPSFGTGLAESKRYTIAPPGHLPLRSTRFSLVDVPDLRVIPAAHPHLRDIWMGAGTVPETLHRLLNLLAKMRARRLLPRLDRFAPLFYRVLNLMRIGAHRGGMFVAATGTRDGLPVEESWHMVAEGDDGPLVPSMAIEALVRKMLAEDRPAAGARSAAGALDLADYEALFATRAIRTGFRGAPDCQAPLYSEVLGPAFKALPGPVADFHAANAPTHWEGRAEVRHGPGLIARGLRRLFGFPQAGDHVHVRVEIAKTGQTETWTRVFDGRRFASVQRAGQGRDAGLMVERFGAVEVALALVLRGDRMYLVPRRWSCLGVPLPKALLPGGRSFETVRDGVFCFDVEISAPLVGRIVAYRGTLRPL